MREDHEPILDNIQQHIDELLYVRKLTKQDGAESLLSVAAYCIHMVAEQLEGEISLLQLMAALTQTVLAIMAVEEE